MKSLLLHLKWFLICLIYYRVNALASTVLLQGIELTIGCVFVKGVGKALVAALSSSWVSKCCTSSYYVNKKHRNISASSYSLFG